MTEAPLKDLFDGIAAERRLFKSDAPKLQGIAARLREAGMDHEAKLLEAHIMRLSVGYDALSTMADGMLDVTEVGIAIESLAVQPGEPGDE